MVNKEKSIRSTIKSIYNKGRQDFATEDEYNDYLEEIEDKVYTLTSNEVSDAEKKAV